MDDLFRYFFKDSPPKGIDNPRCDCPSEEQYPPTTIFFQSGPMFGRSIFSEPLEIEKDKDDILDNDGVIHVNFSSNPGGMFQQFDEMFRSVEEAFRDMGASMPPSFYPQEFDHQQPQRQRPRDFMLKDPGSVPPEQQQNRFTPQNKPPSRDIIPQAPESNLHPPPTAPTQKPIVADTSDNKNLQKPSLLSRLWGFSNRVGKPEQNPTPAEIPTREQTATPGMDTNTIKVEDVDRIIKDNLTPEHSPYMKRKTFGHRTDDSDSDNEQEITRQQRGGVFKRVTVHTYRNIDGAVEERRSIHNGDGQNQSTIQRTLGDQTYSITTKQFPHKDDETLENYINMDENDKKAFDTRWSSSKFPSIRDRPPSGTSPTEQPLIVDQETEKIFKNLFQMGFPGFVKRD